MKSIPSQNSLHGKGILITAGPTWEMIDPVRFLSNRSSGMMGFELAKAAARAGAKVTLITGPVALTVPKNVHGVQVTSAQEMYRECMKYFPKCDVAIMTAAVSDYRPAKVAKHKIKKCLDTPPSRGMTNKSMTLKLIRNPDILATLGRRKKHHQLVVGFALESRNLLAYATDKLHRKKCDLIVANPVPAIGSPTNTATLLHKDGRVCKLPRLTKRQLSARILKELFSV